MMSEDMKALKKEFDRIKRMGLVKCLRNGPTGVGYTFETLINKEEDQESKPDFKSVEIKCRNNFGNEPLKLFHCSPMRNGEFATRYVFEKYGYYPKGDTTKDKIYYNKLFCEFSVPHGGCEYRLKVDYDKRRIVMFTYEEGEYKEEVCYWDFEVLEKRLNEKLSNLAIVYAYPYTIENERYFKFVRIEFYKLKSFEKFLELFEDDKMFIQMYIKDGLTNIGTPCLSACDVSFRLRSEYINRLFERLK